MKRRFGFTLIELVMVIVILGILASVTLPKFVNFKTNAIDRSEDAIIGALNEAIKMKFTQNIVAGSEPSNAWPRENPFTLLAQSPSFSLCTSGEMVVPNGSTWRGLDTTAWTTWYLYCPHYNGQTGGIPAPTKGRFYRYIYGTGYYAGWGYKQGDVFLYSTLESPGH